MARPSMASMSSKNVSKKPTTPTSLQKLSEKPRKFESTWNAKFATTSGLNNLIKNLPSTLSQAIREHLKLRMTSQLGRENVAGVLNRRYLTLDLIWMKNWIFYQDYLRMDWNAELLELTGFQYLRSMIQLGVLELAITQELLPLFQVYSIRVLPNQKNLFYWRELFEM